MNARLSVLVVALSGIAVGIASCTDEPILQAANETGTTSGTCTEICSAGKTCVEGSCSCASGSACGTRCVDTDADADNCGDCGVTCANAEQCVSGTCECRSGLADCGTGCSNPLSDPDNCGGCGVACEADEVCAEGVCSLECAEGLT